MRELVGGKNTIGRTAAVMKSPIKRPLLYFTYPEPLGPPRPVAGYLYFYIDTLIIDNNNRQSIITLRKRNIHVHIQFLSNSSIATFYIICKSCENRNNFCIEKSTTPLREISILRLTKRNSIYHTPATLRKSNQLITHSTPTFQKQRVMRKVHYCAHNALPEVYLIQQRPWDHTASGRHVTASHYMQIGFIHLYSTIYRRPGGGSTEPAHGARAPFELLTFTSLYFTSNFVFRH